MNKIRKTKMGPSGIVCVACEGTGRNSRNTGPCPVCSKAAVVDVNKDARKVLGIKSAKSDSKLVSLAPMPTPAVVPPRVKDGSSVDTGGPKKGQGASVAGKAGKRASVSKKTVPTVSVKKPLTNDPAHDTSGNVIAAVFRDRYGKLGRCGDDLSIKLEQLLEPLVGEDKAKKVIQIGKDNGIDVQARWGHLNTGMARMNLGNMLRRMEKNGTKLVLR